MFCHRHVSSYAEVDTLRLLMPLFIATWLRAKDYRYSVFSWINLTWIVVLRSIFSPLGKLRTIFLITYVFFYFWEANLLTHASLCEKSELDWQVALSPLGSRRVGGCDDDPKAVLQCKGPTRETSSLYQGQQYISIHCNTPPILVKIRQFFPINGDYLCHLSTFTSKRFAFWDWLMSHFPAKFSLGVSHHP